MNIYKDYSRINRPPNQALTCSISSVIYLPIYEFVLRLDPQNSDGFKVFCPYSPLSY